MIYALIAFCVPVLFLVNGALVMNKPFDAKVMLGRTLRMIALCIVWSVITLLALMLINGEPLQPRAVLEYLWTGRLNYINHLWFLQVLAVVYLALLALIPQWQARSKGFQYLFIAIMILYFGNALLQTGSNLLQQWMSKRRIDADFNFFNAFNVLNNEYGMGLSYVLLGGFLMSQRERFSKPLWRWGAGAALLVSWGMIVLDGMGESRMSGQLFAFGTDGFALFFAALGAASLLILLMNCRVRFLGGVFRWIGRNTLSVYLLHRIVAVPLWNLLSAVSTLHGTVYSLAVSLAIVLVCAAVGEGLRRVPVVKWLFSL